MGDQQPHLFVIQTRQKADPLFVSTSTLLAVGATLPSNIFAVDGYSVINVLAMSDQPFQIRIQQANDVAGPFIETSALVSSLDAATGLQKVSSQVVPFGRFMKVFLDNLGIAEKILQASFLGLAIK